MKKKLQKTTNSERLIDKVVIIESAINKLPVLPPLERAKLDNDRAIDHLYYSSKLEGTQLTQKRIERALYGERVSTTR